MSTRRKVVMAVAAGAAIAMGIYAFLPVRSPDITVTISLDSSTFRVGDPIVLHATIANAGSKPVKILEPSLADMTFEVALFDERGIRHDYLGNYGVKAFPKDAGRYLNPGETRSLTVSLDKFFELSPGKYRAVAAYRTLNYPDVDVAFCRIPSQEVPFELLPEQQMEPAG